MTVSTLHSVVAGLVPATPIFTLQASRLHTSDGEHSYGLKSGST
jgi:hypothetical protein